MNIAQRIKSRPKLFNLLHFAGLVQPFSQTIQSEWDCLIRYSSGAETAMEVGTFMAVTAVKLAAAISKDGTLYCIDPFDPPYQTIHSIAKRHIKRSGLSSKVSLIKGSLDQALPKIPSSFEFVFVDGDHSYEGLEKDWRIVKTVVRPGGYAAFHDTAFYSARAVQCAGSIQYYNEVIALDPNFEQVERVASLNVIRRR
jgi:predicted O-methyltransferase YrrM